MTCCPVIQESRSLSLFQVTQGSVVTGADSDNRPSAPDPSQRKDSIPVLQSTLISLRPKAFAISRKFLHKMKLSVLGVYLRTETHFPGLWRISLHGRKIFGSKVFFFLDNRNCLET